MNSWSVPPASAPLVFSSSSFPPTPSVPTPVAGVTQFPTQWEHPHDLGVLKKHLTVLKEDMKPVIKILTDNARSLEDYINNAYLSSVSGGVVYGPVSLEAGTTFNGGAVFNSTVSAGTITASYFVGSGSSLTNIPNSATTATSANTASAIVARDSSGNITVTQVLGQLAGNASTATSLQTARNIGGVSFNGTANINLPGVNATGNQNTSGSSASCTGNAATATTATTASDSNLLGGAASSEASTASTIAKRDSSGSLSATGFVTANTVQSGDFLATDSTAQFYSNTTNTYIGNNCARVINATTVHSQAVSSGLSVLVSSAGTLGTSTSSRRYKENIVAYSDETNKLLTVNPVIFDYKEGHLPEDEQEDRYNQFGLIAEDLHDAGLSHLVHYNAEEQPNAVNYLMLSVELLGVVKNLEARIRLLEARP